MRVSKRREAVLVLLRREKTTARPARRHGVSGQTLYRWRDEFLGSGEAAAGSLQGSQLSPVTQHHGDDYGYVSEPLADGAQRVDGSVVKHGGCLLR